MLMLIKAASTDVAGSLYDINSLLQQQLLLTQTIHMGANPVYELNPDLEIKIRIQKSD